MTSLFDAQAACARQAGLEQRARLLDAVWHDVQGGQPALPERLLINASRGCATLERYAIDLLCCDDGVWRVSRDHVGQHPGAWLLQAPVLAAFLPGLCRLLLGESLQLPSMPVWWFADPEIRPLLAANSRRFCIRHAFDPEHQPVALAGLPADQRRRLQATVDASPTDFIAELNTGWHSPIQHVSYDPTQAL